MTDISIINGDIPPSSFDYISIENEEQFQENLKLTNLPDFCKYMFYKIHIFISRFHMKRIIKSFNEFVSDDQNNIYFINSYNVQIEDLNNNFFNYTDLYNKLMRDPAIKEKEKLEKEYIEIQKKELKSLFSKIFFQDYEQKKNKIGLDLRISLPEQTLNEEIFDKIYPNSYYKYKELMSNKLSMDEIKKIVMNGLEQKIEENKMLTKLDFRKKLFTKYSLPCLKNKYEPDLLKQKNEKKSVLTPFNTETKTRCTANTSIRSKANIKQNNSYNNFNTFKITYQLGNALTDTHSIRIKADLWQKMQNNMNRNNRKGSKPNLKLEDEHKNEVKSYKMPDIVINTVDFNNNF